MARVPGWRDRGRRRSHRPAGARSPAARMPARHNPAPDGPSPDSPGPADSAAPGWRPADFPARSRERRAPAGNRRRPRRRNRARRRNQPEMLSAGLDPGRGSCGPCEASARPGSYAPPGSYARSGSCAKYAPTGPGGHRGHPRRRSPDRLSRRRCPLAGFRRGSGSDTSRIRHRRLARVPAGGAARARRPVDSGRGGLHRMLWLAPGSTRARVGIPRIRGTRTGGIEIRGTEI